MFPTRHEIQIDPKVELWPPLLMSIFHFPAKKFYFLFFIKKDTYWNSETNNLKHPSSVSIDTFAA